MAVVVLLVDGANIETVKGVPKELQSGEACVALVASILIEEQC